MPVDYSKYPPNWHSEIRPAVLARANSCCEECGVKNYAYGYRDRDGNFIEVHEWYAKESKVTPSGEKIIRIILTVAHLDHDETNPDIKLDRLKALCQRDHLRYDAQEKAKRRNIRKQNNLKLEL